MTARIDDTLEKRVQNRQAIRKSLKDFLSKKLPIESVPLLSRTIREKFGDSLDVLLDLLANETDDNVAHLVILVLSESPQPEMIEAARKMIESPNLSETAHGRLAALLMLFQDDIPGGERLSGRESEQFIKFLEAYWKSVDPLEVGHIWISEYIKIPPEEKIAMLAHLFRTGSASYLPIYSVEIGSPEREVARFVAENLGSLNHESALQMLKSLPEFPDTALRLAVEQSIKTLERKKRKRELAMSLPAEKMVFYRAYTGFEEDTGHASVIFAKQKPSTGAIHVFFTLIDLLDRGVWNSFGMYMETPSEFVEIFHEFNSRHNLISHEESDKSFALWLLQQAEVLSIERGYPLPPEYLLSRRLIWDEKHVARKYEIKFGLNCCECGQPIRCRGGESRDALLSNQVALCQECIKKKTNCESCGAPINPYKCYALGKPELAHVTVICEKCYKSAAAKMKRPRKK